MAPQILIIDDEEEFSSALAAFLDDNQFSPVVVSSLFDAREFLKSNPSPDLILLDVMLKDGNGLIFMNELKKQPHTTEIPVIMMSAVRNTGPDRVAGFEFGARDYLNKPFDFREMLYRIRTHLASARSPQISTPPTAKRLEGVDVFLDSGPRTPFGDEGIQQDPLVVIDLDQPESPSSVRLWLSDWAKLILSPKKFFLFIPTDRQGKSGWLGIGAISLGWAIQVGVLNKSFGAFFVGALLFFGGLIAMAAGVSWIVQWGLGFKQIKVEFSDLYRRMVCSFSPLAISSFLGVIYVLGSDGRAGEFTLGPLLLFPSQISSDTLGTLLRRLDCFELWSVGLMALSFSNLFPSKGKLVWGWVFGGWFLVVISIGLVRWLFV